MSAAALLVFFAAATGAGTVASCLEGGWILLSLGVDPAPLITHEAGALMEAVALIPLQKPGFELHHSGFILRAALAGDDLETIPAGVDA